MALNEESSPNAEAAGPRGVRHAPRVSFAIPVFEEEEVAELLVSRLRAVMDAIGGGPHEAVIVDDGSTDRTLEVLESATAGDPRFRLLSLARNFGHQAAITAAMDHAVGDVVLVMDGDLQDPPEALPRFLERWREGFDVVYAVRRERKESLLLRASYFLFYRLIARLAALRLPVDSGDFALLDRQVVDAMNDLPEQQRYLRGLRTWVGFRQCPLEVEREARAAGRPSYDLMRLVQLAVDGIFSFSVAPLRAATLLGFLATGVASLYALYALVARIFFDVSPQGFTALILAIVFLSGVQLLFLGIVGEYLGRVYQEVKRRPHYIVRTRPGPRRSDGDGSSVPERHGSEVRRALPPTP